MEFSISYNNEIFVIKATQKADPKTYDNLFDALTSHDRWVPGSAILSDETELELAHLSSSEIETIALITEKWRQKLGAAKIATIVSGDLDFGMNRMWEAHAEHRMEAIHKTFRSKNEGLMWLSNKST